MAPTVKLYEFNGSSATETDGVTSVYFGSVDAVATSPSTHPIQASSSAVVYSYEKWFRVVVEDLDGLSAIRNIKVWYDQDSSITNGSDTFKTSAVTTGYSAPIYATPINTVSLVATTDTPSSAPATANVGINGSLAGSITDLSVNDKSDLIVFQVGVATDTLTPPARTLKISYEEVT